MYSYWSTLLDGELKLAEGRISEAIEILENVTPPDASWAGWQGYHLYRLPVPRDGLARAYRASDKTDEAISEYHRLLTLDQESGSRFLPDSRYYFQLAKCYEDRGQTESAIGEYERFLQVWSKADDGLPEIESAETRLAVLRESSRN
jgi:tetratricopeptide (TPR) repeat protein